MDAAYLDTLSANGTSWEIQLLLEGTEITCKLDTGAEVTVISEQTYAAIKKPRLFPPSKSLYGPSRQPLEVIGQFTGSFSHKGKSILHPVFVVKKLKTNLLGLPAISSLKLVARIDNVTQTNTKERWEKQFPTVFQGLGTLGEPYEIKLTPGAKPFSLYTARNIAIPLRPKELQRMESNGIISRVDQPTPWCAGMVVVPKKSGSMRICVDLKPLNECVLREVHPLPKVDDILAQLTGSQVFSKLDANSGFP